MSYRTPFQPDVVRVRLAVRGPWFSLGAGALAAALWTLAIVSDRASRPSFLLCAIASTSLSLIAMAAWLLARRRVRRALIALNGDPVLDALPANERSAIDREALARWAVAIAAVLLVVAVNVAVSFLPSPPR